MNPWIRLVLVLAFGPPPGPASITGGVMAAPLRTLADIEYDLSIAARITAYERTLFARAWPSRITDNLADDRPDYVRDLNRLIDEWAAVRAVPIIRYV